MVDIFQTMMQIFLYVIPLLMLFLVIALAVVGWLLYRYHKKYNYKVTVIDLTLNAGWRLLTDKGGVFIDKKTKNKLFFLKKIKGAALRPDNIPSVLCPKGFWDVGKMVFVVKKGEKSYAFVTPELAARLIKRKVMVLNPEGKPVLDKDGHEIYEEQTVQEPVLGLTVSEEDLNWSINAFDRNSKIFDNPMRQLLIVVGLFAVTIMVIAIIFIFFFKKMDVFAQVAASMDHASTVMLEVVKQQQGTQVITGVGG